MVAGKQRNRKGPGPIIPFKGMTTMTFFLSIGPAF
jgi:hypothetical protein